MQGLPSFHCNECNQCIELGVNMKIFYFSNKSLLGIPVIPLQQYRFVEKGQVFFVDVFEKSSTLYGKGKVGLYFIYPI